MRRRDFITLIGSAAVARPLAARGQQPGRMRRVGVLIGGFEDDPLSQRYAATFRESLAKLGWMEGGNLRSDLRFSGEPARIRVFAKELVSLAPDVIFVTTGTATRAVQQETRSIPIVFAGPSSVVEGENVARPQNNITGFPILYPSIAGKWVELLKEVDPRVSRVAIIRNPAPGTGFADTGYLPPVQQAALTLAMEVIAAPFSTTEELERTVDAFAAHPNGGLIVTPGTDSSTRRSRELVRELAVKHRLPAVHWDSSYPFEGGLMSYGSNFEELHGRAATYVDRILRGAKVSELPIERPNKFELVINTKAAKEIGLTIPESSLLRANKVIE